MFRVSERGKIFEGEIIDTANGQRFLDSPRPDSLRPTAVRIVTERVFDTEAEARSALPSLPVVEKPPDKLLGYAVRLGHTEDESLIGGLRPSPFYYVGEIYERPNGSWVGFSPREQENFTARKQQIYATREAAQAAVAEIKNNCDHAWEIVSHEESICPRCGAAEFYPDID